MTIKILPSSHLSFAGHYGSFFFYSIFFGLSFFYFNFALTINPPLNLHQDLFSVLFFP